MQFPNTTAPLMLGGLFLRPISAQLTHDTDFFSKMDPFVQFICPQGQRLKTQVCYGGGKTPQWNEQIEINCSNQDRVIIEIFDHNTFSQNEPVAIGELQVIKVTSMGGNYKDYIPLFWRGQPAGNLLLSASFVPVPTNITMNVGANGMGVGMNMGVGQPFGQPTTFAQPTTTFVQPTTYVQPTTTYVQQGPVPTATVGVQGNFYPQQQQQQFGTGFPQQTNVSFGTGFPQANVTFGTGFPQQQKVTETVTYGGGFGQPQVTETVTYGNGGFGQQNVTETISYGGGFGQPKVTETVTYGSGFGQPQVTETISYGGPTNVGFSMGTGFGGPQVTETISFNGGFPQPVVEQVIIKEGHHHHHHGHHHNNW